LPWEARSIVNERMMFVSRVQSGERMSDLCREFGVSRKTGYKLLGRFKEHGPAGLYDQSRAPHTTRHRTSSEIEELLLNVKRSHPTWGARKLYGWLGRHHPGLRVPAISTISRVLRRHELVRPRKVRRSGVLPYGPRLRSTERPNELWCIDFKGQFRMGNGRLCYPLTVTDHYSRFLLGCEALESTRGLPAKEALKQVFRDFGMPLAMRSDNGVPFATGSIAGLSELSVWWLKLGIIPERIEPGHPEQNGRHERMHLTLKYETTRPAGHNLLQQQERFDDFVRIYNEERPHEALADQPPATAYTPSTRTFPAHEPEPSYPLHDRTLRVSHSGTVSFGSPRRGYALGRVLANELVGLREVQDGRWLVTFVQLDLGYIDLRERQFHPMQTFDLQTLAS
jgi:transposase InsO family protein